MFIRLWTAPEQLLPSPALPMLPKSTLVNSTFEKAAGSKLIWILKVSPGSICVPASLVIVELTPRPLVPLAASGTASSGPVAEATNVMPASVPVKSSPAFSSAAPKSLPLKNSNVTRSAFAVDVKQKVAATNKIEIAAPQILMRSCVVP